MYYTKENIFEALVLFVMGFALVVTLVSTCGCGPFQFRDPFHSAKVTCRSSCGSALVKATDCQQFQAAEDRAVAAYAKYCTVSLGWTADLTCHQMKGTDVIVMFSEDGSFRDYNGKRAYGEDLYGAKELDVGMVIPESPVHWAASSYTHEMAHQMEWNINQTVEMDHHNWAYNGINDAIRAAALP